VTDLATFGKGNQKNESKEMRVDREKIGSGFMERSGLAGWLLKTLLARAQGIGVPRKSRLALVDRISLAPRQSLALVDAEGRRFLVATSQDAGPAFYPLDRSSALVAGVAHPGMHRAPRNSAITAARISW
jgi:hypothetical protein